MNEHREPQPPPMSLVWDWPLRIWHWVFAASITASLVTGLLGDITLMEWHMRLGYTAIGLLMFRLCWALWGGRYARFATFRPWPGRVLAHFRGRARPEPRTAPGAALALTLMALVAVQAVSGLYTTDDIFTEGPLVRHAADETVDVMSSIHRQANWGVIGLIGVHLLAHVIYALRRDPTPLAMVTGRKRVPAQPVRHLVWRGIATAAAVAAAVLWGISAV